MSSEIAATIARFVDAAHDPTFGAAFRTAVEALAADIPAEVRSERLAAVYAALEDWRRHDVALAVELARLLLPTPA